MRWGESVIVAETGLLIERFGHGIIISVLSILDYAA